MKWPRSAQLTSVLLALVSVTSTSTAVYLFYRVPDGPVLLDPERLVNLVKRNFPAQYASTTNPERQNLAFLLDRRKVVQETAIVQVEENERLETTVARAFPKVSLGKRGNMGSACFPAQAGKHGKFCAIWAVPGEV